MNSKKDLNRWESFLLEIFWALCRGFSILPHFVLYKVVAPMLYFIIYRAVKYRKKVVVANLATSFPEKSEKERKKICDDFYVVLSEIMVGSIAQANRRSGDKIFPSMRCKTDDDPTSAQHLRELTVDKSWVALTAHFGMWEYLSTWSKFANQRMLAVYHPLRSKISDVLFKRLRSQHKVYPLAAKESIRFVVKNGTSFRNESYVLGLIADQNPRVFPDSSWFTFLGQETLFFEGGEKIARRMKLPVYFVYQQRIGRGRYKFCFKPIWDGVEEIDTTEITRRYIDLLESEIRQNPHMWLWSHRRWKQKRVGGKVAKWMDAHEKK
ncbi:MAG: lysophospholipid acyltransferase family protein [Rikenellaceae bacterium]